MRSRRESYGCLRRRKAVSVIVTVFMIAGIFAFNGAQDAGVYAGETEFAESPTFAVFETDFSKLTEKGRMYPEIAYGLDGKKWIVCGKQGDELVLFCDPGNAYSTTDFGENAESYETSEIDKLFTEMAGENSKAFSKSERSLMKDVSVTLVGDYSRFSESQYQIVRKLYAPYPGSDSSVRMGRSDKVTTGDISVSLDDSRYTGTSFWSRAVNRSYVYRYVNGNMETVSMGDTSCAAPVMHLNLASDTSKAAFVSAAEPAKAGARIVTTAKYPSPSDTTLYMRYSGDEKVSYSAEYNSTRVYAVSDGAAEDEYLYVQWSENNTDKVKSFSLEDCEKAGNKVVFSADQIGGSGFKMSADVKVWTEKRIDNLSFSRMASRIKEEGPAVPANLTVTRSTNGEADGSIGGLDPSVEYEYSTDNMKTWTGIPKGTSVLKNLASGNYYLRAAETDTTRPGSEKLCRVRDILDVTVDPETGKTEINDSEIEDLFAFGLVTILSSYSENGIANAFNSTMSFDVTTRIISMLTGEEESGADLDDIADELTKVSAKLEGISEQIDQSTTEILGKISSSEMKKELKDITGAVSKMQRYHYDDMKTRLDNFNDFYSGKMLDQKKMMNIDNALHYFYSAGSEERSLLTGELYHGTKGTDFYKEFTYFGDSVLNAAPGGQSSDVFALYEGICSYAYNFNSETFEEREDLYDRIYNFYLKGYAVLSTAVAYDMTNHQDYLKKINALELAAEKADSAEEKQAIEKAIKSIVAKTGEIYGQTGVSEDWVKEEHNQRIKDDKERLRILNQQYADVKAAYDAASDRLNSEKQTCELQNEVRCYRNQKDYCRVLKIAGVNEGINFSSTGLTDYFSYHRNYRPGVTDPDKAYEYFADDMLSRWTASDAELSPGCFKGAASQSEINALMTWSKNRGMSMDQQMEKVFNCSEADSDDVLKFSDFSSSDKYSKTLGYYTGGGQKAENDGRNVYFFRYVNYFKDGKTGSFQSVKKGWSSSDVDRNRFMNSYCANDVLNNSYVIILKDSDAMGKGGGDGLFVAEGRAGKSRNRVSWSKVDGAAGYDVYSAKCGKNLKKIASVKKRSYVRKKLNSKSCYKYKVKAYSFVDGKKKYIAETPLIHVAGIRTKYSNARSVKMNRDYLNMVEGKSAGIKCKVVNANSKKPVLWKGHIKGKVRYMSSDRNVAVVNSKGVVTAKGGGDAYIYACAANGVYDCIEVYVEQV